MGRRRKKREIWNHPVDTWLGEQIKKTGGLMIFPGTPEFEAWRRWRRMKKMKTRMMDQAEQLSRKYMVPTRWPDFGEAKTDE